MLNSRSCSVSFVYQLIKMEVIDDIIENILNFFEELSFLWKCGSSRATLLVASFYLV